MVLTRSQKARCAGAVFAVFLIFTAFFAASQGSGIPIQRTQSTSQPTHESEAHLYRFWEWAAKDAITVYTFLLAIFTAALAFISIVQIHYLRRADKTARTAANAARSSAETARQTLIASHRAWVRINVSIGDDMPLIFNAQGAQFAVRIQVTNTGEAPALRITHHAWLLAHKSGVQPLKRQQEMCEGVRGKGGGIATTLFPDEIFPQNVGVEGMTFNLNASQSEIDEGLEFDYPDRRRVQLFVIVCTNYTFPSDPDGCHQTRYLFDIRTRDWKAPDVTRVTIPSSELLLMEGMGGAGRFAD